MNNHNQQTKTKDEANLKRLETTSHMGQEQLSQGNKTADTLSTQDTPKVIILDDNPISILSYAEEFPENWKKICNALVKNSSKNKETSNKKGYGRSYGYSKQSNYESKGGKSWQ
jgi:hypothetical protein